MLGRVSLCAEHQLALAKAEMRSAYEEEPHHSNESSPAVTTAATLVTSEEAVPVVSVMSTVETSVTGEGATAMAELVISK